MIDFFKVKMSPPIADSTKNVEPKCSQRKINKPLIEKRRRARINDCLAQLKTIVLEATETKSPRPSKLEKADILEMTVEYVKNKLTTDNCSKAEKKSTADDHLNYVAGYSKCLAEISHFLEQTKPANYTLKEDIVEHVSEKLKSHLTKDDRHEQIFKKLPIPPLCKQSKEQKGRVDEAIDLSVSSDERTEMEDENLAVSDNSVSKEITNQKPLTGDTSISQSAPIGLLCGGQVMLLVQLPQSMTSQQVQVQNIQTVNQSQSSMPMIGVQPLSVTSQPQIINQTLCRNDQTLYYTTPLALPQIPVASNQIQRTQSENTIYPNFQNNPDYKHRNHWRPW
ncbi:protein hairy-like [Mercenaria mercenaria]|uniref:protein hairy-like n=1 Tax=Mercenaria mercenaria TaxID=6596 RepID=UPI00234EECC6|nr:protein hairy-like [Mercenaria mercenaria]